MCLLHINLICYLIIASIIVLTCTCGMITFKSVLFDAWSTLLIALEVLIFNIFLAPYVFSKLKLLSRDFSGREGDR